MSEPARDLAPSALAQVIEANISGYFACIGSVPGADLRDDAEMLVVAAGTPTTDYNVVLRCRFAIRDAERKIEEALAPFRERGLNMVWYTSYSTRPQDLDVQLERHGLIRGPEIPGMAVELDRAGLDAPVPDDLAITRVADAADMQPWVAVYWSQARGRAGQEHLHIHTSLGLGSDAPWRHYIGWLRGEPVATSVLYLGADVAGIYRVATLPVARGHGIGTAMTLAAMREARAQGYHYDIYDILDASADTVPLYLRLGFEVYCTFSTHYWGPGLSQPTDR